MTVNELHTKVLDLVKRGYGHMTAQVKNKDGKLKPITGFYSVDEYNLMDILSDNEEGE